MKKFLIILTLLIVGPMLSSTTYQNSTIQQEWKIENAGEWGSFYWGVERITYPNENGLYYYYVYFYSNSLFNTDKNNDGQLDKAITYIKEPTLYMYEYRSDGTMYNVVNFPVSYIICDYSYDVKRYSVYFYSHSKYNTFKVQFNSAWAYNYSNK